MSIEDHLPALQIVVPLLLAPVVTLLRVRSLPWAASTATSALTFVLAIALAGQVATDGALSYAVGGWQPPYGIELAIDQFSVLLLLIISGASTVALVFGKASLDREIGEERAPLFFAAWLLVLAALCGMVTTGDAFNLFVFLEISSLASYVLIAAGPDRRALMATHRYIILGTLGATFYLIGVGLIYMMTGTLNLADMALRIGEVSELRPVLVAAGFITMGLALKAAMFPVHAWMPNAYAFAPHAVSVFLAACATKAALYVLIRFDFVVFLPHLAEHAAQVSAFFIPLAVVAFLVGSTVAVFERNLKRMLGYSSVAQIGYILLGVALLTPLALTGAIVHLFNHALIKGALFMAVVCIAHRTGSVQLPAIAGCARAMPLTMAAFVVAGLSMIGVPLTVGFVSKWYLIQACLEFGVPGYFLAAALLLSSLLAVVYVWKVVEAAYFKPRPEEAPELCEAPPMILASLWLVTLANLWFGIDSSLPLGLARAASMTLLGEAP
ncbi:monovalent cation/H+ antiporter subunit D family protein [Pseudohaliea rubra]|uniref:NADH:ubiquinone oxidoreductase subunit 5 (Chain L)/Multisubunit Na+/H+ antiporter, MnhA subunit n=1 Tax=Pseudohaliea rubra DSM 19751 TaxID=1265313 RepID=A0A095WY32_9GAMM|nr:monovalent cation/H+ antiporter subunit D family protein [Pseudohaliea rubra]KGE03539.1 NADH:ubiquinone oxidoreductase subunit 5 (chain L)/Multisubunit Na+/H+ antiporter, MnhA subunit [Pseudohaliea rubra DSM 19751]